MRQVDNATDASQDVDIGPSIALMNAPENVDDDAMVGPVLESEVEDEDPFNLPISHEVTLEGERFCLWSQPMSGLMRYFAIIIPQYKNSKNDVATKNRMLGFQL